MKIITNNDYKLAHLTGANALFPQGKYTAIIATNQPNYKEEGKVFIQNLYGNDILLTKDDYTSCI